jgi:Zn finger protein HypA/HybF involved in hydrogenase expression
MSNSDYQYGDGTCNDCGLIRSTSKYAEDKFETCPRCDSSNTKFKFVSTDEEDLFYV